ncbi:hypothetical protein G6F22_020225 [Rhizopus arrhizus]|nr:hypothetical protein G6F22_020225 [Rhizopus arrhizus]
MGHDQRRGMRAARQFAGGDHAQLGIQIQGDAVLDPAMPQCGHAILFHLGGGAQGVAAGQVFLDGPAGQFQQGGKRARFGYAQAGNGHQFLGGGAQQAPQAGKTLQQAAGQVHHVHPGNARAQGDGK